MKQGTLWTVKETEIIKEYYPIGGAKECQKYIDRTIWANYLNIK